MFVYIIYVCIYIIILQNMNEEKKKTLLLYKTTHIEMHFAGSIPHATAVILLWELALLTSCSLKVSRITECTLTVSGCPPNQTLLTVSHAAAGKRSTDCDSQHFHSNANTKASKRFSETKGSRLTSLVCLPLHTSVMYTRHSLVTDYI